MTDNADSDRVDSADIAAAVEKTVVWEGDYINAVVRGNWEFVERKNITGIVGMVPVTDDGKLVLVEQSRPALGTRVIELPAGLVGDTPDQRDEPFADAAWRELLEETGYSAGKMTRLFSGVGSPGITSEQMTFFLATELVKDGPGGGDETEDITVHEIPLEQVVDWLARRQAAGAIIDLKIYAGLYFCARDR